MTTFRTKTISETGKKDRVWVSLDNVYWWEAFKWRDIQEKEFPERETIVDVGPEQSKEVESP